VRQSPASLLLRYAILVPITIVFAFPFYWMLVTSLNTPDGVFTLHPSFIPRWQLGNYQVVLQKVSWTRYIANTIFVAGSTTILVVATSVLAGYAFAAMNFPGKALVFTAVLAVYMVPSEVTLVPNFIILKTLGWIDSYQAQIIPFAASVFGIFLMRQFFLTLPRDLWEAAQLDGCDHLRFLWLVALPLARPAIATVAIFHFVLGWNAFIWPLIVTNSEAFRPLQVGLSYFSTGEGTMPHLVAAGGFMTTLPVLVLFFFAQRQLVGGIAATGIRG